MTLWAVKVNRYTGGESILGRYENRFDAEDLAASYNTGYQTDSAYVEKWKEQA